LLVGVTLVTMTAVGTATTKTVVNDIVDEQYPVDVMVQGADISGTSADSLERVDGVDTTALLSGSTVDAPGADVTNQPVAALPDGAETVARDPDALPSPEDGEILLSEEEAEGTGVAAGDSLRVTGPAGSADLPVAVGGDLGG